MRTFLALAAICTLVTGVALTPAHAISITFSTEASLNNGPFSLNPSYEMYPGTGSLHFSGLTGAMVDTDQGTFSLGSFNVTGTYGVAGYDPITQTSAPVPFTIKLIQSSPLPGGSDTISGSVFGSFGVAGVPPGNPDDWSTLKVTFTDNVVAIDGFVYMVEPMTTKLHLAPQSVNAAVPEPSTLLLVGTALGLTGLAGLVRRKKR